MRNRKESGITLVALVVTLVVLLILAGITIATLFGDNGIIKKAQKAKDETEQSSKNELDALNSLEGEMENAINGSGWRQPDPLKPEITNGEITLKIGDYIDYNCKNSTATYTSPAEKSGHTEDQVFKANEYQYGWRVLGVDKNTKQLQLISEDFVPLTGGGDRENRTGTYYYVQREEGYVNGVGELNNICSIYGTGEGAIGARTVNVDDINWITGYNPNNTGKKDPNKTENGTKYHSGLIQEYGNNVKYTLTSSGVKYEPKNGYASGTSNKTSFKYYDEVSKNWKILSTDESVTLKSSSYDYYPTTLTETDDTTSTVGIEITSPEYKMLFTNSSTGADPANSGNTTNFYYWLGSPFVLTELGYTYFGFQLTALSPNNGVRPVVTLDSKVTLKNSGTEKDGCKLYNMTVNNK